MCAAHLRSALGYTCSQVLWASSDEVVWICGNTLVLRKLNDGTQRILRGTSYGIQCFTVNRAHGLIAFAEKGPNPAVHVYSVLDLKCITTLPPSAQLGYTALAFSADGKRLAVCTDEPDLTLTVQEWRQAQVVVHTQLVKPIQHISFHPLNSDQLCSTGSEQLLIWSVEKMWDRSDMVSKTVDLDGVEPTCHAYFPGGVYVGGKGGELLAVDPAVALGTSIPAPAAPAQGATPAAAAPAATDGASTASTAAPAPATQSSDAATPAPAPRSCIIVSTQATANNSPVAAIALNRDLVAVAGAESIVRCFTQATPGYLQRPPQVHPAFELRAESEYGAAPLICADFGGPDFSSLVLGSADGTVHLTDIEPGTGDTVTRVACEAHHGPVAAMRAHPTLPGHIVSCGADGTLRVWDAEVGRCVARRTFSSAQTALSCCPGKPLLALGSETGVVRLVSLATTDSRQLMVAFRRRLHSAAVQDVVFSDTGEWLATAGKDRCISFTLLREQGGALVLGHVTCPSPVLNLVWPRAPDADEACVLASLVSGAVMCATVPAELAASGRPTNSPDMQLSNREVNIKVVKLESPLLHAVGVAGHKYGELVGLGADKQLHKVMLPVEGQSWAGIKGRATKSSIKVQTHSVPNGAIDICSSGRLLVTASADGHIATHGLDLGTHGHTDENGAPALHDVTLGGATAVSFDLTGRWVMSAGPEGSMFMFETTGGAHLMLSSPAPGRLPGLSAFDQDAMDEPSELIEPEVHRRRLAESKSVHVGHHSNAAIKSRLEGLRQQLLECMQRNETAEELDKIERMEFIIDQGLVSELKSAAAARVVALRQQIQKEHLHLECVAARIKATCWDAMDERKGESITGMRSGVEVNNFPLLKQDDRVLRKVRMLRRMELVEERREARANGTVPVTPAVQMSTDMALETPTGAALGARSFRVPAEDADHDFEAREEGADSVDVLLYNDLCLHGRLRKTSQLHFFRQQVWQIKAAFNAEFEAVVKLKKQEADKVHDLNARLDETARDLTKLGAALPNEERFSPPFPEDMLHVLSVKDEEVKVEKVLSEAERAAAAARRAEEAGGTGQRGEAGMAERALRQMMGGTLASKDEEADPYALEKPAWMDGNPKLFSEEQLKELKEFQAQEKVMMEEKAKRVATLEAELRGMKALIDEAVQRFDDALAALLVKKLRAKAEVTALESRCVALAVNIDRCETASDSNEQGVYQKFSKTTESKNTVSADLAEKRALLASVEAQAADIVAEDKQLNHNFKREFIETEPYYGKLLHLYRFRQSLQDEDPQRVLNAAPSRVQRSASIGSQYSHATGTHGPHQGPVPGSLAAKELLMQDVALNTLEPFPPLPAHKLAEEPPEEPETLDDAYRPDGLDSEWWYQFVQYRAHKVHNENKHRQLHAQITLLQKEVAKLDADDTRLAEETRTLMDAAANIRKERQMAVHDTDLQLRLKAGQVETEPPALVSSDLSAARFVHRAIVEGLNDAVHVRGSKKMEILTAIKDFKKGIYQLEWEQKRCDMMVDDLREKTRELQMFHVTRDLQAVFNEGEDRTQANESANLEALARQREVLHKKLVVERQKQLRKVNKSVEAKQAQNEEVTAHLVTLERVLAEQERLRQSMQSIEDQTGRRMRSLVTHKKLKEIATAQQLEMRTLASELDKMRMRTYPTFVEPAMASLPPDAKAALWK